MKEQKESMGLLKETVLFINLFDEHKKQLTDLVLQFNSSKV